MELILNTIGEMLVLLKDNFIQICIILSIFLVKKIRMVAVLLLFTHLFFGYQWYTYAIALLVICYHYND